MKTELYTAFQLSAIRITAAVMLLAAVIGSVLHWVLRSLMKIDPSQIGGATGDKIQQVIGNSDPSSPHFQLQGLDVTGTASQSSGIGLSYVVVTVLGILLVAGNFRHGAVMWKVLRGRGRWGLNMLGTVAVVTAAIVAVSCLITVVVTSIATALSGVDWAASTSDMLLVWLRGIIALTLLAVASAAVTLATHSGPIAGVVMGVVYIIEATVTTLGTVLGWDSHAYGWLPLQSIVSAVGVSNTAAYGTMAGMLLCAGWAGLATIIGLGRVKTYNL